MSRPTLSQLKPLVSAEEFDDDDTMLQSFLDAAIESVAQYLRRDLDVDYPSGWPAPIQNSALILAAYYNEKLGSLAEEAAGMPAIVTDPIASYRNLS